MRFSPAVAALFLNLLTVAGAWAAHPMTPRTGSSIPAAEAAAASGDAAAKHAKRTTCLRDAKAKKLVGAEKSAFIKGCISAP